MVYRAKSGRCHLADTFGGAQNDLLRLGTVNILLSTGGMKVERHQMQIKYCFGILVLESRVEKAA